ncbi:urea ABC transporter substrate-binding protein [Actinosynnema pretiosum subsp. pretiosum]|uniref:Urea ABC transporter, urea binding protein n=2 Tax=Actinosynnema TaxID=40566 RepID=C6WCK6_ACTMD|nr:urea ABC transporter substrate-binding protein [Actinosynnema mirum]ACU35623.1 urea ABC transporter, urea binding protein [Actinosynnema mirum DSM 43827]AXX29053.1 Urea ABC transporter, substrate binding protein UrtA [Actinosynnema pretiosum subsp. pretiosum]QUF06668.1 urea ABC transporter substrate-binding protein [Actinosynnema pretiosum subsp. pretiosum]
MRSRTLRRGAAALFLIPLLVAGCVSDPTAGGASGESATEIRVGVLHSLSGTMAISEVTVRDAELLAVEQLNASGGVLGKKLVPVVEDGASDWPTFAEKAQKLISQDRVAAVFGGWTSASRKAMLPVFERNKALLWYPVQYEGLESSPYIFYTGATTNQQIVPALDYLAAQGKKSLFLVGSDYVFPRTANKIIKAYAAARGIEVLGEEYTPLGHTEYSTVVNKVVDARPDAVFNTLNGDSNVAFFKQLRGSGVTPERTPVVSVSVAEEEVRGIGPENVAGHLVAWNYYQTTETQANSEFVRAYRAKYGADKVTSDPMEAGYNAVKLWAAAVTAAGTTEVEAVREAAGGIAVDAPEGRTTIDGATQHVAKTARIGVVRPDGQIEQVWASDGPIAPDPYLKGYPWASGLG